MENTILKETVILVSIFFGFPIQNDFTVLVFVGAKVSWQPVSEEILSLNMWRRKTYSIASNIQHMNHNMMHDTSRFRTATEWWLITFATGEGLTGTDFCQ